MARWYALRDRADGRRHAPRAATLVALQQEVRVERIAFVGLGTMGAAMAANLRRAGFEVTVWNRTPGRAAELVALGAVEAATPADAARAADVVVTCVSDTPDVDAVLFGPDGVADGLAAGGLVIDCSTISPAATAGFAARLRERGRGVRGRAGLGRVRGREERDADDLRGR